MYDRHGLSCKLSYNPTYNSWAAMRGRCNNPRHKQYDDYGGRGITVCRRWDSFVTFLDDMGEKPPGLSLERKNNNKGYSKSNCVWATPQDQAQNRRSSKNITIDGETMCMADWARRLGITRQALRQRLRKGWNKKDAFSQERTRP